MTLLLKGVVMIYVQNKESTFSQGIRTKGLTIRGDFGTWKKTGLNAHNMENKEYMVNDQEKWERRVKSCSGKVAPAREQSECEGRHGSSQCSAEPK